MSIFCFISLNINEKYYFKMFLITWNTGSLLEIICFLKLIRYASLYDCTLISLELIHDYEFLLASCLDFLLYTMYIDEIMEI